LEIFREDTVTRWFIFALLLGWVQGVPKIIEKPGIVARFGA